MDPATTTLALQAVLVLPAFGWRTFAQVTAGLFGRARNPITGMLLFATGSALAVPTPVTVIGLLAAGVGIAAQGGPLGLSG